MDYVANVVHVNLVPQRANDPNKANDETLAHLGRLGRLEFVNLNDTAVTDAGLAHLKGLTKLNSLDPPGRPTCRIWNGKPYSGSARIAGSPR
jgi:hypothetical protein